MPPDADQGLVGLLMLVAGLAAAGAFAGVVGAVLRVGGGIVLLPALLGALPLSPMTTVLPALAMALTVNAGFSAMAARYARADTAPKARTDVLMWSGGGVVAAALVLAAADMTPIVVAIALIAAGAAMLAPPPAILRRLRGGAMATTTVAAALVSTLAGAGAGSLGPSLAPEKAVAFGRLGVALCGPAAILLWMGLLWRDNGNAVWLGGVIVVAGAAYLAAPLGARLAPMAPAVVLRALVAIMAVAAGFSLLRTSLV